ncbi:unnamed protein product [Vicia faba]|uniref:Uncharacterized protein n=1 Tax=Vicia faba TaxID=3906 RepID=A0AAV0Z513_VICFA|nr:unnamed protein product [Vicia faba]
MSAYWLQVLSLPNQVMNHIEAICRSFLWSGSDCSRKAPIAWETICKPKVAGGLNVVKLQQWNQATLGKLLWNIHMKADRLWIRWLDTLYFKGCDILDWQVTNSSSWILKKIVKHKDMLKNKAYWKEAVNAGKYKTRIMYKAICGISEHMNW